MTVSIKFGQMEAGLAKLHRIADDKRTQFQARLRKFQRQPINIPTLGAGSRGSSTSYSPLQVMEVALALQLTEFGMGPERMVRTLNELRWSWVQGMGNAARTFLEARGVSAIYNPMPEGVKPTYMLFDPNNLEELTQREGYGLPRRRPGPNGIYDDPDALLKSLDELSSFSRFAFINLTRVLAACQSCFVMRERAQFSLDAYIACRDASVDLSMSWTTRIIGYGLDWTAHWMKSDIPNIGSDERSVEGLDDTFVERLTAVQMALPHVSFNKFFKADAENKTAEVALLQDQRLLFDWGSEPSDTLEDILARFDKLSAAKKDAPNKIFPMLWLNSRALSNLLGTDGLDALAARAAETGVPILTNGSLRAVMHWLSEAKFMNEAHEFIFTLSEERLAELGYVDDQKA